MKFQISEKILTLNTLRLINIFSIIFTFNVSAKANPLCSEIEINIFSNSNTSTSVTATANTSTTASLSVTATASINYPTVLKPKQPKKPVDGKLKNGLVVRDDGSYFQPTDRYYKQIREENYPNAIEFSLDYLKGKRFLDAGSGSEGNLVQELRLGGVNAVGIDIAVTNETEFLFRRDIMQTGFAENIFDVISSNWSLFYYVSSMPGMAVYSEADLQTALKIYQHIPDYDAYQKNELLKQMVKVNPSITKLPEFRPVEIKTQLTPEEASLVFVYAPLLSRIKEIGAEGIRAEIKQAQIELAKKIVIFKEGLLEMARILKPGGTLLLGPVEFSDAIIQEVLKDVPSLTLVSFEKYSLILTKKLNY